MTTDEDVRMKRDQVAITCSDSSSCSDSVSWGRVSSGGSSDGISDDGSSSGSSSGGSSGSGGGSIVLVVV